MAQATAMTFADAAATIAEVRGYRQGLTARAAGTVWMVWGLALAGIALIDVLVAPTIPDATEPGWNVQENAWAIVLVPGILLLGATVATNTIWKAHAREMQARHQAWVTWLAVLGVVAVMIGIGFLTVILAIAFTDPSPAPGQPAFENTYVFVTPILSSGVAFVLSLLQRRRVPAWPGLVAGVLLLAWMAIAPFVLEGGLSTKVALAGLVHCTLAMVALGGVGLLHFRRG